ncbi:hypothetical protein C7999DRAFT_35003 [Corynascus novoguineensis]|uniref:NmrA-like domain-containing protein n=1 Tax=Corynascus novoguineensis TaxID=1126955 RepID=A0AAN7HCE8_9PEZI|nr:hypothetical protein C7999DRAFT_35003 [Corynascus novoguineensis]
MTTPPSVIVFGPTGGVASTAVQVALTAGARVTLAMRDPSKPLPASLANDPSGTALPRVKADLTDPASVRAAVAEAGSPKAAFLYFIFGTPDRMRSTVQALRDAGAEYVVFLSTSVLAPGADLRAVAPAEFVGWHHAGVEIALEEIFGRDGYAALRPGYFASNLLQHKKVVAAAVGKDGDGVVRVPGHEAGLDFVLPEDIGRVAGRLLVRREANGPVTLLGPELLSLAEGLRLVGKALGKTLVVEDIASDEDALSYMAENIGLPEAGARYLLAGLRKRAQGLGLPDPKEQEEAAGNILKYGGQEAGRLQDWLEANHGKFLE